MNQESATQATAIPTRSSSSAASILRRAVGVLPTALAFAAIAGVGYWGHRTGWTAPGFSALSGSSEVAKEDWCTEHGVPDSRCIKCHPELVNANAKDWCPEHGLPESKCTICHPELLTTGVAGDWCIEHGVPESSCTLCHPEITELTSKGTLPPSETGATVTLATNTAANIPTQGAPSAADQGVAANGTPSTTQSTASSTAPKPKKDPKTCQTHNLRVQFASADAVKKAGVGLGQVVKRPMVATLTANAETEYNRTRLAKLSSTVSGKVWRVDKEIGQSVKQGEVIALLDSAEVGKAKAEFFQAAAARELKTKTLNRLKQSSESGLRTAAELQEAEAAVTEADIRHFNSRQALINLGLVMEAVDAPTQQNVQFMGLPKAVADALDPKTTTANLIPILAPFDGTVIERSAVAGEVVDISKPLFTVADTRQMWVTADISLSDSRRVALGRSVTFRPDGAPDEAVTGVITWISTAVDDQTRTVKVRADVPNPDGRLLAHMFGKASVTIRETPAAIAVASDAIQWEGCCHIAFVRLTDDIYQTRKLKIGSSVNGYTEVLIGLVPGEIVATQGSHVLKSEILKSALGAGCTDGH